MMSEILIYILIFSIFGLGLITGLFIGKKMKLRQLVESSGTIVVTQDNLTDKIVYSLVLDDYPETLQFKKMVVFKIDRK